jgi:hypothetical protein
VVAGCIAVVAVDGSSLSIAHDYPRFSSDTTAATPTVSPITPKPQAEDLGLLFVSASSGGGLEPSDLPWRPVPTDGAWSQ